ncbi:MAG: GNAT family N-acetyltransferase [Gemmatimonadales bacterium]
MTGTATPTIREGAPADRDAVVALLPRLAAFDLPPNRVPAHLWEGDAELVRRWAAGDEPDCLVHLAVEADGSVAGAAVTRMRPELLSHEPSAHLEALVVREGAEGRGIGGALMAAVEAGVRSRGARTLTLHVFRTNERARALYARLGFDCELLRYLKQLE